MDVDCTITSNNIEWDEKDTEKALEFSKDYQTMDKTGFDDYGEFMKWIDEKHDSISTA